MLLSWKGESSAKEAVFLVYAVKRGAERLGDKNSVSFCSETATAISIFIEHGGNRRENNEKIISSTI